MMNIKAVIFDMDGVLIDSEIVYLRHQYEVLRHRYSWVTQESLFPLVGMSTKDDYAYLARLLKKDENDPGFRQEIRDLFISCEIYYPDILRPQVVPMLKSLRSLGLSTALASSSSSDNINTVLTQCGLTSYFDCIVSGDQFEQSKPDPEIYLYTMERLGRTPEECLVVEDSTYGVQAAHAAGAFVVAIKDDRFCFDQSLADIRIDGLDEVIKILGTKMEV